MNNEQNIRWVSVSEMAEIQNVSTQAIYDKIKKGRCQTKTFHRGKMDGYLVGIDDSKDLARGNENKAHKELLKQNYEKACNDYVAALLDIWELDAYYGFWIADEVGGLYDYGEGVFTIGMEEIIYCVENNIQKKDYTDYVEYNVKCLDFNLPTMKLEAWHMGAPRIPQEKFDHLDALKKELNEECQNLKECF